jgi:hypothetical protein
LYTDSNQEKNYLRLLGYGDIGCDYFLLLLNNIKKDGYIHILNDDTHLPTYPDGEEILMNPERPATESYEFILEHVEAEEKAFVNKDYAEVTECYIKEKPSELLPRFLTCFEENIYDIPEGSIIWDTPLLKETMSNYRALKAYAKEQGWV